MAFTLVIGIGAFQYGYSIGVYNTLQDDFALLFNWDEDEKNFYSSLITSICSLGSAIGAIACGSFNSYGKKTAMHFTNLLVVIGAGISLIKSIPAIVIGRFLYGLAAGIFSVYVPAFINELAPVEMRGPLGSWTQILITVGIMISFFLGLPIPDLTDNENKLKYKDSFEVQ